jgi:hypothetical protein
MNMEWEHRDLWVLRHKNFAVEVSRHIAQAHEELDLGPNRWCVYVYVYPTHPLSGSIDLDGGMWQNSLADFPLHAGCTFFKVHQQFKGEVASVQIGCDYNHYEDDCYSHMATKAEASSVFRDAEELFVWMLAKVEPAPRDIAPRDLEGGER